MFAIDTARVRRPRRAAKPAKAARHARRRSQDLSAADWIEAALELLAEKGVSEVSIVPLAKTLGVTKGSFYWHFDDRHALHAAMLETWRRRATLAVIERLDSSQASPEERLRALISMSASMGRSTKGASLELAIRHWARRDARVMTALAEVDQQRLAYLRALFRTLGASESDAAARAHVLLCFLFGDATLAPAAYEPDIKAWSKLLLDL